MYTTINEFKQHLNENNGVNNQIPTAKITDKDWDRMLVLVLADNEGESVAKAIKDKNKAMVRFVCGLKLDNSPFEFNTSLNKFNRSFSDFGNKALQLGATVEEIENLFNLTEVPAKYLEKIANLSGKKLNNRFVGSISKAILDAGFDINYLPYGGRAITHEGIDAMSRNGRKWTIGYKTEIIVNGVSYSFTFDAITDEGDGPTTYVISGYQSDNVFRSISDREKYGKNKFISVLLEALAQIV